MILFCQLRYSVLTVEPILKEASKSDPDRAVVVIDAGHGGEDPGVVSDYSGITEKDLNLRIAQLLKSYLEQDGYTVIMTRTEDCLQYNEGTTEIYEKENRTLQGERKLLTKAAPI